MEPEKFGRREMDKFIPELCSKTHYDLDSRLAKVETAIERLQNRLPNWATLVISGLSAFSGFAANHIFFGR